MEEIEVKFLNVDPDLIEKKLKEIGAKKKIILNKEKYVDKIKSCVILGV